MLYNVISGERSDAFLNQLIHNASQRDLPTAESAASNTNDSNNNTDVINKGTV